MANLINLIPSQAIIALAVAILTSGLTLLGIWITNRSNNQRLKIQLEYDKNLKNDEVLRERLEELYVEANKYLNHLVSHYFPYRMVMEGTISFNDALDLVIEQSSSKETNHHRVTMLIDLYFVEVKPEFEKIIQIREKLNDIIDGYKQQYQSGNTDGSRWLTLFQPLLEEIAKKADGFEQHVAKIKISA